MPDGIYVSGKSLPSAGGGRRYASDDEDYPTRPLTAEGPRPPFPVQDPRYAQLTRPAMSRTLSSVSSSGYSDSEYARPTSSSSSNLYAPRSMVGLSAADLAASPQHIQGSFAAIPRDALPVRPENSRQLPSPAYAHHGAGVPARSSTPAYAPGPARAMAIPVPGNPRAPTSSYATRSPEDKRILDAFRLGL